MALNDAPAATEDGTDWLAKVAPLASGAVVGVGVGVRVAVGAGVGVRVGVNVTVGVRVGVGVRFGVLVVVGVFVGVLAGELVGVFVGVGAFVGVLVGVSVGPTGVMVGVGVGVVVGALVGVFVGVEVKGGVGVSVGVAAVPTGSARTALLFDMSASPWSPITPATTERFPDCRGVAAIATLEAPVAGHITVVEGSLPVGTMRQGPAVEFPELIVTAGKKIAVTHTPLPPAEFT